jgi:F-type H+-transporting ATPase subunit delta
VKTPSAKKAEPVANLYAKALFELASETKSIDAIAAELEALVEFLSENQQLKEALSTLTFSAEQREKLAADIAKQTQLNPVISRLFQLLTEKNRLMVLPSIYAAFRGFMDEGKNIVRGTVTTVEPLSEAEKADLSKAFGKKLNKQVVLEAQTDKEILGGLVVEIQGLTFDGSLKTTIRRLRENLERQSI